jgi:biopolymer transport protein ExbD
MNGFSLNPLDALDDEVDLTNLADPLLMLSAMLMMLLAPFSVIASNLAELPGGAAQPTKQAPAISFDAQGALFWDRQPISSEELKRRLAELRQAGQPNIVYLAGDRDARYETSLVIKAALAENGIEVQELVRPPEK